MRFHPVVLSRLAAAALCCASGLAAQILSYKDIAIPTKLEFMLPWRGPGAAVFNPARLAEVDHAHAQLAIYTDRYNKTTLGYQQGAVKLPFGIALGLGHDGNSSEVDNSNAYFAESEYHPMAAYGLSLGPMGRLDAGVACPIYFMNAFGAVKSHDWSLDLGFQWRGTELPSGEVTAGLAVRDLFPVRMDLPPPMGGTYRTRYPKLEADAAYVIPGGMAEGYLLYGVEFFSTDPEDGRSDDNPFYYAFGVEVRPMPWIGIKWERTRSGTEYPLGLVGHARVPGGVSADLEASFWHDQWTGQDSGLSYLYAFSVGIGL